MFVFICESDAASINMSKDLLKEKWISVRGVPTYILCQGSKKNHNTVVIIIPGLLFILHFIFRVVQVQLLL